MATNGGAVREQTVEGQAEGTLAALSLAPTMVQALAKAEHESQIDIARRNPRSVGRFLREVETLATVTQSVAEKMFYTLQRRDKSGQTKPIRGKSIRFAEVAASAYGNVRYGARVVDVGEREVVVRGAAFDLEKNVGVEVDVVRRITRSDGSRYGDDMITVTTNAAVSLAMRNALMHLIPAAYTDPAYEAARAVAVGSSKTIKERRSQMVERFAALTVTVEELLAYVERPSMDDVSLDDIETLIGIFNSIRDGVQTVDEVFRKVELASPEMPKSPAEVASEKRREPVDAAPAAPAPVATPADVSSRVIGAQAAKSPAPALTLTAESVTGEVEQPDWIAAAERAKSAAEAKPSPAPAPAPAPAHKIDRTMVGSELVRLSREKRKSVATILSGYTDGRSVSLAAMTDEEVLDVARQLGMVKG
jgi:hypothetical protein